jgi:hypothetical protein
VVEAVIDKIAAGGMPTLQDIADILLKRSMSGHVAPASSVST